jgi:protease YdgD
MEAADTNPHVGEVAHGAPGSRPAGRIAAVLAMALLACNAAAATPQNSPRLPGIGNADPRQRADASQPPWRAVARLQVPGVSRCTAVLVAPTIAATAAHCLWSRAAQRWVPPSAVHLLIGYAAGAFSAHLLAAGYRVAPGYDPANPDGTRGTDFALVKLLQPGPAVLALAPQPPAPGAAAVLGGYNQDRNEIIEADFNCTIAGPGADRQGHSLLVHTCTATRGTSGGPLLVRGPAGHLALAGIEVGAPAGRAGGVAVPAAALKRLLDSPWP